MSEEVVRNIFKKGGDSMDYGMVPEGANIMGLVGIKICTLKYKDEEKDGYQLIFRSKNDPNAYVNYRQTAILSDKSNLGKALKRMTGSKFSKYSELTEEQAYKLLLNCLDKWYEVQVIHRPWKGTTGEVIFCNVDDNDIRPVVIDGPLPIEFFNSLVDDAVESVDIDIGDINEAAEQTSLDDDEIPF